MKVLLCMLLNWLLLVYQKASEFVHATNIALVGPGEVERLKPFLCLHPPECLAVLNQCFLPVFLFFVFFSNGVP